MKAWEAAFQTNISLLCINMSGKRTREEEELIAKHQQDIKMARQVQRDAEAAELLARRKNEEIENERKRLYEATKGERNKGCRL